jgi:hypothetical protein
MTRRKIEDRYIRSLTKGSGGTSYSVIIPVEFIRTLKWRAKQKLEVKLYQDRIIIRDWKAE